MPTPQAGIGDAPLPSPFPEGWFFVASRREVLKAGLIEKTWMGEDIIVWCDDQGRICVADAACPHLGADLGPTAGGRICDGRLVCPFHGFEFETTGECVATPYAKPPKSAWLRVFETREVDDLVFAWWGIDGRPPQWNLPAESPDQTGWSRILINTMRFPGHPQETTENSVDLGHLRYVHGYGSVERPERASVDGPLLKSRFNFRRTQKLAGIVGMTMDVSADTSIYGLGYSFVEIREHSIGMDLRLWVLAAPVDGVLIDLTLASQVREIRKPRRWIAGLGFSPGAAARSCDEQVHGCFPGSRRPPGSGHLEEQAVPSPSPPLPFRRRSHDLQTLLRPVLSRSGELDDPGPCRSRRRRAMNVQIGGGPGGRLRPVPGERKDVS